MDDIEISRLREKALFSGWSRDKSSALVVRLLDEIIRYKSVCKERDAVDFAKALDLKVDDHEMVVVEFATLQEHFGVDPSRGAHEFVERVMGESGWNGVVNEANRSVTFYKKKT